MVGAGAAHKRLGLIPMSCLRPPRTARSGWPGRAGRTAKADILLALVEDAGTPIRASETPANEWSPALAIDKGGRIHVAYDSYAAGNYDVVLRTRGRDGVLGPAVAVARTPKYETRPSLAIDPMGRVWVAYEERTDDWGKDAENLIEGEGSSLYRDSFVRVRCVDGDRVLVAPDPVAEARRPDAIMNSFPRLACDRTGQIWLAYRHRQEVVWGNQAVLVAGGVWVEHVTTLLGRTWSVPQVLARSDGLLDNRPALVAPGDGPLLIVYNTDGRLRREVEGTPKLTLRYFVHSATPPGVINNELQVAALATARRAIDPVLVAPDPAEERRDKPMVHPDETGDVARMRDYRIAAGGKSYRLLRGDFHRHTEISMDGGHDGALEDLWRYGIDAARFDWMGDNDHDNGAREYSWWLVQKTTDMYDNPAFHTMFTYERSVVYPNGHRSVMLGVPRNSALAAAVRRDGRHRRRHRDALRLPEGLRRHLCLAHLGDRDGDRLDATSTRSMSRSSRSSRGNVTPTSTTEAATGRSHARRVDWRLAADGDDLERPVAAVQVRLPGVERPQLDPYQLRGGDHRGRQAALRSSMPSSDGTAMYATDNILLDARSGEHIMGDEFDADGPVRLKVLVGPCCWRGSM